jgi:multidrug efflux pump subunit AcrB
VSIKSMYQRVVAHLAPQPKKLTNLQRLSLYFYQRPRKTALIALLVTLLGVVSYTTLLKREGFPSIDTPFALGQGTYLVNDAEKVDRDVAKPLADYLLKQKGVDSVTVQSSANFYIAQIGFKEGVDSEKRAKQLQENVIDQNIVPENAGLKIDAFKFGYTPRGDNIVISVYSKDDTASLDQLTQKAQRIASLLVDADIPYVEKVSSIDQAETAKNPFTGQEETKQKTFERYLVRKDSKTKAYDSVLIGIQAEAKPDKLKLYSDVESELNKVLDRSEFDGFSAEISASDKPNIEQQISELQTSLLEGLIAVLIVGSLVIAVRASLITVISMIVVIAAVNAVLYLIGYSLNTMTLFALILSLSLIVDDTIIMVEAIEAQRKKRKNGDEIVTVSTGKVAQAMIAATSTAALSFAPLLFVGGIIGTFIKAIPITIILALFVSLVVALILIPLLARYLLLSKSQIEKQHKSRSSANLIEERVAEFIARPMLRARHSSVRLFVTGLVAIVISFGFIGLGGYMMTKVQFNIFPPAKDTNKLEIAVTMPDGSSLDQAKSVATKVSDTAANELGGDYTSMAYFNDANQQSATIAIDLKDYKKRDRTSVQMVDDLTRRFEEGDYAKEINVRQVDAGPPAAAFSVRVDSDKDRQKAIEVAKDIEAYLDDVKLKRVNGTTTTFKEVSIDDTTLYTRADKSAYISITGTFKDKDTSTLVTLAEAAVKKEFDEDRLANYGLDKDAIAFSAGQEDDNQDSFKTMLIAFPLVLLSIYVLLAAQFRSLLQPLIIFMAIPFSFLGVTLGLYVSDNPFSFFAMMGFFALIGLSIKNTILLTDYANQERRRGEHPIDAIHNALAERFRPLIATSLTAIVSLVPLALASPFWEGLAIVLMAGLLSSTFLVVVVFPYYYLGAEFLRIQFNRNLTVPLKKKIVTLLQK